MNTPYDQQYPPPRRAHKWSRISAPTSGWRERLLRNCLSRMKTERDEQLSRTRRARCALLAQEHSRMTAACGGSSSGSSTTSADSRRSLTESELTALIEDLEAALAAERREEEAAALAAFDDGREEVEELVEFERRLRIRDDGGEGFVLCPVCAEGGVHVRNGVVFCRCGLRLDGGTYDGITLDIVRARLEEVVGGHARRCDKRLVFAVAERFGFSYMGACCSACGMDCIVL